MPLDAVSDKQVKEIVILLIRRSKSNVLVEIS